MKFCDSHSDCLTFYSIENAAQYLKSYKTKNIKTLCCAVFTSELKEDPLLYIEAAAAQIKALNSGHKFIIYGEDCSFLTKSNLKTLIDLRPVSCGLTWHFDNSLAGGDEGHGDITPFGTEVIKTLEQNNIFIDTAHLNRKSFYQVCGLSKKPIYNSHCGVYKFCRNKRNLTDQQIKYIFDTNGFMGIYLVSYLLSKKHCSVRTVAEHFDYVIRKFGYKNVGLGTDFFGTKNLPARATGYDDLHLILKELKDMGHSRKIIKHIAHKNYTDFLKRSGLL
ncbi:MAG: membrane dipeptidase [Christensenellaceae bacterium]|jgi:membrane dipeptidase|nr:membrane dipeptidase [Christensenellaceae bacterium]